MIAGIHALVLGNIHILLSSRREAGIERALRLVITSPALCIETSQLETDIEIYVRSKLSYLNLRLWTNELRVEAEVTLVSGANSM